MKEATARIKINKLLEEAGWRFFDDDSGSANISLEPNVKIQKHRLDELGNDFESTSRGFVDFLLLNEKGFPTIVLEAKAENKEPLIGKEQARKYAKSLNCRFVILSNGNLHYFWDLERGNPYLITAFPSQKSMASLHRIIPDASRLVSEEVKDDYVALTQRPTYSAEAGWNSDIERPEFIRKNGLRFLRRYQLQAITAIQNAVRKGSDRFLLEMATGTGKTLTSAAIIKLFLKTGNAQRVLFLVDRLELEDQALKAFRKVLANDYKAVIYKESRDDWRHAEIVVTTVQSLLFNNKYQRLFSPTDFDLVISDEAHRSISGNARAVFDFFIGYKLGLTATPRDYLKNYEPSELNKKDPREFERRMLIDTYRTFGCEDGQPTFRYSLLDGVRDGFLINPTVVDARSEITTQLLSDRGFVAVSVEEETGKDEELIYRIREFERRFFSDATNRLFCKTFLENGFRDPVTGEFGKSIVFAVSQNHAAKLVQVFNEFAETMYPSKYNSDFALQVTSDVANAQEYTSLFSYNKLSGSGNAHPEYKTSKTRICVTVGMMTTGYDCPDILNLGLFRPIFSPTDFIQIKGRGTRKHDFLDDLHDEHLKADIKKAEKKAFKLFDFFANCEFFEEKFDYDQVIKLPPAGGSEGPRPPVIDPPPPPPPPFRPYFHTGEDKFLMVAEEEIGLEGMKVDRMFYQRFEDRVINDKYIVKQVDSGNWEQAIQHIQKEVFNKPADFFDLDKLRKAAGVDRRLSLREILEKAFGFITRYKTKDELLEEEFNKFVSDYKPDNALAIPAMKHFFKAYITDDQTRTIINSGQFTRLATNPVFMSKDLKSVPEKFRKVIPEYIKDYVSINQFLN